MRALGYGAAVAALLLVSWPASFLLGDLGFGDLIVYFYPMHEFIRSALAGGHFPFWWPECALGQPFLANHQSLLLYPPHFLVMGLEAGLATRILIFAHLVLFAAGMARFLRDRGLDRAMAPFAFAFFAGSGYVASLANLYTVLFTLAWLPWMLVAIERLCRPGARYAHFAGLSLTVAMAFLAGDLQFFALCLALAAGMAVLDGWDGTGRRGRWPWLGLAVAAGLAMVLFSLVPTLELLSQGKRTVSGRVTFEDFRDFSSPKIFLSLLSPHLTFDFANQSSWAFISGTRRHSWILSLYSGAMLAVLAPAGFAHLRRRQPALFRAGLVCVAAGLALGCDWWEPATRFLYLHVPFLGIFRYQQKYLFLTAFGLGLACPFGLQSLLGPKRGPGALLAVGGALCAYVFLLLALWLWPGQVMMWAVGVFRFWGGMAVTVPEYFRLYGAWAAALRETILLLAAVALVLVLREKGALAPGRAAWAVSVLLAAEILMSHAFLYRPVSFRSVLAASYYRQLAPRIGGRVFLSPVQNFRDSAQMDSNRACVQSQALYYLREGEEMKDLFELDRANTPLMQMLGVPTAGSIYAFSVKRPDYLLSNPYGLGTEAFVRFLMATGTRSAVFASLHSIPPGALKAVLPNPAYRCAHHVLLDTAAPLAAFAPTAARFREDSSLVRWLSTKENWGSIAITDPRAPPAPSAAPALPLAGAWEGPNAYRIRLGGRDSGYVLFREDAYPGWTAEVDGRPAAILPANATFQAVRAGPGAREAVFRFRPRRLGPCAAISAATLGLLLAGFAPFRRRSAAGAGPGRRPGDRSLA